MALKTNNEYRSRDRNKKPKIYMFPNRFQANEVIKED